jgi:RNA polymerase sigma-70 factor (ECF subfamily)
LSAPTAVAGGTVGGVPAGRSSALPRRFDPECLGEHVDRLFRAAWAMCGDPHDAEDLVQETCARVLARPRWLRHGDDLGYLLRVLHNVHISRLRRNGRRPSEVPLDDGHGAGERWDARDPQIAFEVAELFAAISRLPSDAREVVIAVDVIGLSYREAAKALKVKEATVTTRLHRARRRVAETVEATRSTSKEVTA